MWRSYIFYGGTQLRACEGYCRRQGYEIFERFHEESESAKTTDRSQLQTLLKYCRTHKGKVNFVVAERILSRASDLWVQASLDYKRRLQQLFFPEGIAFDGNRFNRTAATAPLFKVLGAV
jgi:DNA invertase Pin-like site-specific DNA recombinase